MALITAKTSAAPMAAGAVIWAKTAAGDGAAGATAWSHHRPASSQRPAVARAAMPIVANTLRKPAAPIGADRLTYAAASIGTARSCPQRRSEEHTSELQSLA